LEQCHPDENQLIRAIVDEAKLPDSIREHLSLCPRCRAGIQKIEQDLNNLGQTARQLAPIDDEFIEFVIPDFETDSLSYYQGRKGVKLC